VRADVLASCRQAYQLPIPGPWQEYLRPRPFSVLFAFLDRSPSPTRVPLHPPLGPALFLLGGIELRGVPTEDADRLLAQSKVVALVAYLALSPRGRFQRRDRIVGLLWPELDQSHARAALRKAMHLVRGTLGSDCIATRGDEELAIADGGLWCDAAEVLRSADEGQLARTVDLYRGDLMPGFHLADCNEFDVWLEDQRSAALERVVAAAWALAQTLESDSNLTEATRMARYAARLAWNNERVLRRSLVMLDRLGDRAGALRLFDQFARRLRRELEAEPSPETMSLIATMRSPAPRAGA
jgi:DNA-binding SARP family transcriptional activator